MKSEVLAELTPTKAQEFINLNVNNNRHVSKARVNAIAKDMKEGKWHKDGSPVRFDIKDRLIDGQHRMHAVVQSDVTLQEVVIVTELPERSFETIDTGKSRTAGDVLSIYGKADANTLASVLAGIHRMKSGDHEKFNKGYQNHKMIELADTYPKADASVAFTKKMKKLCGAKLIGVAHYLFSEVDQEHANRFIKSLALGIGLDEDEPLHIVRTRLENNANEKDKKSKAPAYFCLAWIIKAWRADRLGESPERIGYKASETSYPNWNVKSVEQLSLEDEG